MSTPPARPALGIQGPVVAWSDPWAPAESEAIMRTGTGIPIASHDPAPTGPGFVGALADLGADFYVHHVVPTATDLGAALADLDAAGIDIVLGNEYGNINGPFVEGTNRWDVPAETVAQAAAAGRLAGVLYDEPEHLQIHADQYRKDAFLPHFGETTGLDASASIAVVDGTVRGIVATVDQVAPATPVLAEHVFPVMFHTLARAGMTPAPKVMKESFQPLQLVTALGAALQYGREFWICADLWGPDTGPWFTRAPGFPGHSPAEFASALRLAYLFAPTRLFVENVDVLLRHRGDDVFERTEFGEVWTEFVRDFVPRHPLTWSYADATADIAIVHADDSDFGRGHQPFGNRERTAPPEAASVFEAWHLVSHGTIPAHGSCQHIPGFDFPRHSLNGISRSEFPLAAACETETTTHGLFHASRSVLAFDEHVSAERLGSPELIVAAGSRLPENTLGVLRTKADAGATVVVPSWLTSPEWSRSARVGDGEWVVTDSLLDASARAAAEPHLGRPDEWTQRFGDTEVRFTPATGPALEFSLRR